MTGEAFAETAAEWEARREEAARYGLIHKRDAERRGERIDRLRRAVAELRAERDALAAALAAVVAVPEAGTVAPNLWVSGYNTAIRNVRAAARVEHPPAAIPEEN